MHSAFVPPRAVICALECGSYGILSHPECPGNATTHGCALMVVEPPKDPGPDKTKVFEVWSIGQTSIDRHAEIAHSSTTSADDMNAIHDAANKRIRVQAFATKDGGMKLSHGTYSFKSPGDADADASIIDTVFRRYEIINA